ncbi:coiled-coil domain-containing protein 180 [Chanos chanos]|uniref:Coiled-coil domain-containing protein 180 n=1 Tax=Chanos chanos TaxID=29144 RepID=A0A6J2WTV6_CHACN|nr:coiled-coil domain-containing protein 180 [Chanos chanos]
MTDTRVVPSGKVYRQIFDAQVQLSLSLHDTRRRRINEGFVHDGGAPTGRDGDTALDQGIKDQPVVTQCSGALTKRDQIFSGSRTTQSCEDQGDEEEVRGLPDNVVSERAGSDIVERLNEKKQRDYMEAIAQLHQDLSILSGRYEPLVRQAGEDIIHKLSEYDDNLEKLMQKIENFSELEILSFQELHEFWNTVSQEFINRRTLIKELDEILTKYEFERTAMISLLLRKYTRRLERISYVMPCDVHRLIDNEAMVINQAVLLNRRAIGRLYLSLMEKNLQKEASYRMRWEDKLQDWKRIKVHSAVSRFRYFMDSEKIQSPKDIRDTLETLQTAQRSQSEQCIQILHSLRTLTPPKCSKSLVTEWYSTLSALNEQIDCMHIDTISKLHKYYEHNWQDCLEEVERFKEEVANYGLTLEETQDIVKTELLPLIGKCQTKAEERLAAMDKAFEALAKNAAHHSKLLFKFMRAAAHLWEVHTSGMQKREKELQDQMEEISQNYEQDDQRREAHLDLMMDKLRQESSEEALKSMLEKTLHCLDESQEKVMVYMTFYKEKADSVECYPSMVLQELNSYSSALSQFFGVKEVYYQDSEELHIVHPPTDLERRRKMTGSGKKRSLSNGRKSISPNLGITPFISEADLDWPQEFLDSQAEETFTTAKGNLYHCQGFVTECSGEQETVSKEAELALFPMSLLSEIQKDVRIQFFSHLEERYHTVQTNTLNIVEAKTEELKSELDLRVHLHQSRAQRIKMDIHDVRAAELMLHRDRVERHYKGVLKALTDLRTGAHELLVRQHKLTEDFRAQTYSMKDTFILATKSDILIKLHDSLQSKLEKHINTIQILQRNFRQKLEMKIEGLRESNAQLMRSFKLFSDGGNFTPMEIQVFHKRLEKLVKCISSVEEAIMQDMEGTESKSLEQAKEIVSRFEEKFHFLTVDLKFLEKIQGILTNTQIQIKAEVTNSNMHKKKISHVLHELEDAVDAYAHPGSIKRAVTQDDIFNLTTSVIEELKKRCQYLDCFLDPAMLVQCSDSPLQGSFAVAARPRSRKQDKGLDGLLQPSRMGVPFTDDAAVGVVKTLLRMTKPHATQDANSATTDRGSAAVTGQRSGESPSQSGLDSLRRRSTESVTVHSVKRFSKPTRSDKRFQVFGSKPEAQTVVTFKGFVTSVLWKTNDILLLVAEEFYKTKERRPISRPQYLQETFEQCAEEVNRRLLKYQSQTHDYHNSCLQEFRQQLRDCENCLKKVPGVLFSKFGDHHLEALSLSMTAIRQQFDQQQQQTELLKKEHSSQLRVRLSHPACEKELERLALAEEERQRKQTQGIQNMTLELKACLRKHGDEFVTALASSVENMLFQMDNLLTVDEVHVGQTDVKKKNITTLVRQNQAAAFQEEEKNATLTQRGNRTWPGICYFDYTDAESTEPQCRETASITTVKTTQVHLRIIEARDTVYQRYRRKILDELACVKKENDVRTTETLRWQKHWKHQLTTLSKINSE